MEAEQQAEGQQVDAVVEAEGPMEEEGQQVEEP